MRNEEIRRILQLAPIDKVNTQWPSSWFGHVLRRDADNVTRRVMELVVPGTRRRGRPKKTWHQHINDDMVGLGVALEIALKRKGWRRRTQPLEYEENAIKVSIFTFSKKHIYLLKKSFLSSIHFDMVLAEASSKSLTFLG